jgi:hypothetical protein
MADRKPVPSNPKKKRITAVVAKREAGGSLEVTSFVFSPKSAWTAKDARAWLKAHGKKSSDMDETGSSFRFRQADPEDFVSSSFRTILITDNPDKMGDFADVAFGYLDQALTELLSERFKLADLRKRNADPRLIAQATADKLMNQWSSAAKAVAEDLDPDDIADGDEDLFVSALNRYSDRVVQGIAQEAVNMAYRGGRSDGLADEVATQGIDPDDVVWLRSSALEETTCDSCRDLDNTEVDGPDAPVEDDHEGPPDTCLCTVYADLSSSGEAEGQENEE